MPLHSALKATSDGASKLHAILKHGENRRAISCRAWRKRVATVKRLRASCAVLHEARNKFHRENTSLHEACNGHAAKPISKLSISIFSLVGVQTSLMDYTRLNKGF
jgi:hypothetical protein